MYDIRKNNKNENDFLDNHQFGQRRILQYDVNQGTKLLNYAREIYQKCKFNHAFDIYDQLSIAYPSMAIEILAELYDQYEKLPNKDRYSLYQSRFYNFGIKPSDKVLDVGSGSIPFHLANHLVDITIENDNFGRAGVAFKHIDGIPIYECNLERLPFEDNEFDFVYCSHVLEHVNDPDKACSELMRVGKRGFIESPTPGKDIWLNIAKASNHRWAIEKKNNKLIFSEYSPEEIEGLQNDILMNMHVAPRTPREKAFSALIYLKADKINTMLLWEGSFEFTIYRRNKQFISNNDNQNILLNPSPKNLHKSNAHRDLKEQDNEHLERKLNDHNWLKKDGQGRLEYAPSSKTINQKTENWNVEKDTIKHPSIIFLNTYYLQFLQDFYRKNPGSKYDPYHLQLNNLQKQLFGDSDFYSANLNKFGWSAEDIIVNCEPLQFAWLKSNNIMAAKSAAEIAIEQVRQKRPDVVYFQNLGLASEQFIQKIRPYTELIVGQIASPIPPQINLKNFDIIFSSFPHFVDYFRRSELISYYQKLAFDPCVLEKIQNEYKKYDVTFVGSITPEHKNRIKLLEHLAKKLPLKVWGYGYDHLPRDSELKSRYAGEAWGLDMFQILMDSRITINHHINTSEEYANNMRLYEATGCGALLITDYKENLSTLFEIGKEIVTYRSPEEGAELVQYYLNNPREASTIAKAGQDRTLKEHTYEARMEYTSEILKRHLVYKGLEINRTQIDLSKISYGYERIESKNITSEMERAWKSEKIPQLQRDLVQVELNNMYHGKEPVVYQALADCIRPYTGKYDSVAEIGCASGYYSEILEYLLNTQIGYVGIDYSKHLIKMARNYYPERKFCVADGALLPFNDNQFQIIISSGLLLHVPNFEDHIIETVRVCKNVLIAHRNPVCRKKGTQYFKKMAYGEETSEMRFNEDDFLKIFFSCGLSLVNSKEYYIDHEKDNYEITYVFEKSPTASKLFYLN